MAEYGIKYGVSRNDIINRALARIRIAIDGEEPTEEMIAYGTATLQDLIASWENGGIHLWKVEPCALYCDGRGTYRLPSDACMETFDMPIATADAAYEGYPQVMAAPAVNVPFAAGQKILICGRPLGITAVEDAGGGKFRLTLARAPRFTIPAPFPAPYWTQSAPYPLRIDNVRRIHGQGDTPIRLLKVSRQEILAYPPSCGEPTVYSFLRRGDTADLTVWPAGGPPIILLFDIVPRFTLPETSKDEADFPREWTEALIANLAYKLSYKYGAPDNLKAQLKSEAESEKLRATMMDAEIGAKTTFEVE